MTAPRRTLLALPLVLAAGVLGFPGHAAAATDYQAESATISQGVVESNHSGFTGTGFVNYDNVSGSFVQWPPNTALF